MKKLLLVAFASALCGTGCRHKPTTTENYPPVFAPLSPMAAYKSSATGYPAASPRAGMGVFR